MKKELTPVQKKHVGEIHEEAIRIIDEKLAAKPRRLEKNRLYRSKEARLNALKTLYA